MYPPWSKSRLTDVEDGKDIERGTVAWHTPRAGACGTMGW